MTREPKKKSFPWRCLACGAVRVKLVTISYTTQVKFDGKLHEITIKGFRVPRCGACKELVLGAEADQQISQALREHLGLLGPEEIRARRKALGLTQRELAATVGVAEESLSRWETGTVMQSRSTDNLLRLCFDVPQARSYLQGLSA